MIRTITEQDWVCEYVKNKEKPLPVVLGSKGTWSGNGKPMIILIGFSVVDVLALGDLYGVAQNPVREMKQQGITYYAINIVEKKKVKEIMKEWN